MATFSKGHAHETLTRRDQCCVDSKVSRAARECLHIDSPLLRVKVVGFECALLSQELNLIDEFVTTVVTSARVSLRILVRQARSLQLECVAGGEVLRCNKLNASELSLLLAEEEICHFGIELHERLVIG